VPEKHLDKAKPRAPGASADRAREIVASLRAADPADVFDAFRQLDALPLDDVRDALASWTGPLPDLDRLDPAVRRALGLPPRPLRLRTLSVARDADVLDLGPVAEEQVRLAGKSWDGADLAPEERLDGELEGSFAGTLERRVLGDADAPGETPLFDVLLFAEDSGVVFAAGTTNVVALIAYRKVEMRDRRARVAIEEALAARGAEGSVAPVQAAIARSVVEPVEAAPSVVEPVEAAPSVVEPVEAAPSVVAAVEATVEESIEKRPVGRRKTAAKKASVKKAVAKKVSAKEASAKKAVAKKAVAKKAVAKKAVAKRASVKKAVAKKPPAKKRKVAAKRVK
jgi:hypothetical protein